MAQQRAYMSWLDSDLSSIRNFGPDMQRGLPSLWPAVFGSDPRSSSQCFPCILSVRGKHYGLADTLQVLSTRFQVLLTDTHMLGICR